jgi:acetylornithine deacetylase/succinyl-diaminopimelate desuccinylase-like protein
MTPDDPTAAVVADAPRLRADLERLARIPSIAFPGFPEEPVAQAAQATADLLREAGLVDVRLIDIPGAPPAVWGESPGPEGAPTVLLYAHYDVQPAGDESAWTTPPWEPTERGGRLYGRGTADDKSGIALHAGTLRAFAGRPPVHLKVVVEGEEETGRGTFAAHLAAHPEQFDADLIVVADAGNWRVGEPTLTTSLRGLAVVDLEVRTLRAPVHSGLFGGAAPDALIALTRMLATLHDDAGDVAVEGLVRQGWEGRPVEEAVLRDAAGVLDGVGLVGAGPVAERLYTRPSITAIGLDAPPVDGAANALVPAARARLSARLAPGQDPAAAQIAISEHLRRVAPWGVEVGLTPGEAAPGALLAGGGPGEAAALRALEGAYGKAPVKVGSGGAIPLCVLLAQAYPDAEIILWGAADDAAQIHAADESVDLGDLRRATLAQVLLLQDLGRAGRG